MAHRPLDQDREAGGMSEHTQSEESKEFDAMFLHNFGEENPIPIGARALCGVVSARHGEGVTEPLRVEACPICVALTEGQS